MYNKRRLRLDYVSRIFDGVAPLYARQVEALEAADETSVVLFRLVGGEAEARFQYVSRPAVDIDG